MKNKTQRYNYPNKTRINLINRYNRQQQKINSIVDIYNTYEANYYARKKRKNVLQNSYFNFKSLSGNLYDMKTLSNKDLSSLISQNSKMLRTFGSTYKYNENVLTAFVMVQLNNEAYLSVDWFDSDPNDDMWEVEENKQEVYSDMLLTELITTSPNLKEYTLRKILEKSLLDEEWKEWIIEGYYHSMEVLNKRRK